MKNKEVKGRILSQAHQVELKKLRVLNLSFNVIKNVFGVMVNPRKEIVILAKPAAWKYLLNNPVAQKDFRVIELATYKVFEEKINLKGEVAEINMIDTERYLLGEMGAILDKKAEEEKKEQPIIEEKQEEKIEEEKLEEVENQPTEEEQLTEEKTSKRKRKKTNN